MQWRLRLCNGLVTPFMDKNNNIEICGFEWIWKEFEKSIFCWKYVVSFVISLETIWRKSNSIYGKNCQSMFFYNDRCVCPRGKRGILIRFGISIRYFIKKDFVIHMFSWNKSLTLLNWISTNIKHVRRSFTMHFLWFLVCFSKWFGQTYLWRTWQFKINWQKCFNQRVWMFYLW